jgi:hypothetical protein
MKPKPKHLHHPNITYISPSPCFRQTTLLHSVGLSLLDGDNICKRPTEDSRHKAKLGITKKGKY